MAFGDTNLTNVVLDGDLTVGDDADVVGSLTAGTIASDTTLTAGTSLAVTTTATVGTSLTVSSSGTGVGEVKCYSLSLYDSGTGVYRTVYLTSGTVTVV